MAFTKEYKKDFYVKNNRIVLSKKYLEDNKKRFKKITGSRFAAILNKSEYTSPVKVWAMMVNIYTEPLDETYAKAGNIIEPKIKNWVCKNTGINFKQYNPTEIGFDVFKNNKIFGGIPDGEPVDENGNLLYPQKPILEIKTTSIDSFVFKKEGNNFVLQKTSEGTPCVKNIGEKRAKWFDTKNEVVIPLEYMFQLGLYCYLRNVNTGMFAICFLKTEDYKDPEKCNVDDREIRIVDFNVDLNQFKLNIEYAEKWYAKFIETGISPVLTPEDLAWLRSEVEIDE